MTKYARLAPYLLLIAFGLLFFWKLAFTDMILARGDTYAYFYPYWDVRNAAFRAGELPLWTPDIFMGAPLLANPQLGTFYPPNWLTIPFNAPDAIRYSILLHIVWAAAGAFVLFRQTVTNKLVPALLAASIFALSGYLGAHVEQINQLQGLAWMPWLFYFFHQSLMAQKRVLWGIVLAVGFALQIFSGHTQTVFISGVGLGIYALIHGLVGAQHVAPLQKVRTAVMAILILGLAAISAVLLAIPQILPTLELTGMSNRGGGFTVPEATAFSLPLTYLGRALLPSYDGQLFTEYVGYVGVIALGLAILAIITLYQHGRGTPSPYNPRIIWIVLAMIGLLFALGRFNPLYWQLAALPGFNLFRVPARWLSLFVLAVAMLAGMGLAVLQSQKIGYKRIIAACVPIILLILMGRFVLVEQVDIVGSSVPTRITLMMWGVGLAAFVGIALLVAKTRPLYRSARNEPSGVERGWGGEVILLLVILELFLASRVLPYNDLTPRDVYEGQRFTISQLLAYGDEQTPPGRVLSISQLYFDPGDKARLLERYQQMGMDEQAIQTAFTAVKRQEMLFPNLSMTWGIPSIDGYEGGVLPTIYYSQFTSLLLPEGTPRTIDGRLGELLARPECRGACIPDWHWLTMTDTRYVVTDKVYDIWHDDIAYDTAWARDIDANRETEITFIAIFDNPSEFVGNKISILYTGDYKPYATFRFQGYVGNTSNAVVTEINLDDGLHLIEFEFDAFIAPYFVEVFHEDFDNFTSYTSSPVTILGVSMIDTRTNHFVQLEPENRLLSSDIKLYEVNSISNRAFYVHTVLPEQIFADNWRGHEDALVALRNCRDEICTVLHGVDAIDTEASVHNSIQFTQYTPTYIELTSSTAAEAYLILNDAYYPGWRATVNGEETQIYRANVMFRAVSVPAGESTVIFEFVPMLWYRSMAFGAVMWLVAIIVSGIWLSRRR